MKSKLFLSLSLLTAVFSMNANIGEIIDGLKAAHVENVAAGEIFGNVGKTATPAVATTSKVAPVLAHPTTQFTALAAGTLVVGTAVAGATVYGAQKAYGYMYPKQEVKLTRFESAKLALHNGYTTVKTNAIDGYKSSLKFVKANPKSTAGAVAAVAALGLVAYKYSDSIFGKSKAEAAPEAPKAPVRVAHVRALRD